MLSLIGRSRLPFAFAFMCVIVATTSSTRIKEKKKCKDLKEHHIDESIYNIPIFREALKKTIKYNPDDYKRKTRYLFGDKNCPKRINHGCPHHYVMNFDANRRPAFIYFARCTCIFCKTGECRPFLHYRFVQERDSVDQCFRWRLRGYPTKCDCQEGKSEIQPIVPSEE